MNISYAKENSYTKISRSTVYCILVSWEMVYQNLLLQMITDATIMCNPVSETDIQRDTLTMGCFGSGVNWIENFTATRTASGSFWKFLFVLCEQMKCLLQAFHIAISCGEQASYLQVTFQEGNQMVHWSGRRHCFWQRGDFEHKKFLGLVWLLGRRHPPKWGWPSAWKLPGQ